MPSGYRSNGVDFDDLFDPYVQGPKSIDTGRRVAGVDLSQRYAHIQYGTKRADVGYRVSGTDVSNLWAAKGSASYNDALVIPFGVYSAQSTDSHDAGASLTFTINPDGTWSIAMTALHSPTGTSGNPVSGTWHKAPAAGVGNNYEMQATAQFTVSNGYNGDTPASPTYTATTGWLPLSAARQLIADTSHLSGGGAGSGMVDVSGHWTINIRKVGGTQVKTSTLQADVEATV